MPDDLTRAIEARAREARAEGAAGALTAFMHEANCGKDAALAAQRAIQWEREAEEARRG